MRWWEVVWGRLEGEGMPSGSLADGEEKVRGGEREQVAGWSHSSGKRGRHPVPGGVCETRHLMQEFRASHRGDKPHTAGTKARGNFKQTKSS